MGNVLNLEATDRCVKVSLLESLLGRFWKERLAAPRVISHWHWDHPVLKVSLCQLPCWHVPATNKQISAHFWQFIAGKPETVKSLLWVDVKTADENGQFVPQSHLNVAKTRSFGRSYWIWLRLDPKKYWIWLRLDTLEEKVTHSLLRTPMVVWWRQSTNLVKQSIKTILKILFCSHPTLSNDPVEKW